MAGKKPLGLQHVLKLPGIHSIIFLLGFLTFYPASHCKENGQEEKNTENIQDTRAVEGLGVEEMAANFRVGVFGMGMAVRISCFL